MPEVERRLFLAAAGSAAAASLLGGVATQRMTQDTENAKPAAPWRSRFAVNAEIWWSSLPFMERVRRTHAAGFPAIEFWPLKGKPLQELKAFCAETGLEVAQFTAWGFSPGMNEPKEHDRFLSTIEETLKTAAELKCRKMTVVAGNDIAGRSQREMHDACIAALKRAAPMAEAANVMLILEPMNIRKDHKGHCLYGSPDAVRICREVNSPMVKINWDFYHMQISEGDLCRRLKEGFDQFGYAQIADNPGRNEPGTGEVQYGRVLRALEELGYRDYIGLECWPRDGEEKAIERLRAVDQWVG
jgi:hydroxypyruvate isomerase